MIVSKYKLESLSLVRPTNTVVIIVTVARELLPAEDALLLATENVTSSATETVVIVQPKKNYHSYCHYKPHCHQYDD